MITYLYVKTHNITGLKYLGKTNRKDPHKYPGSGVYWSHHIKKHGSDFSTEILRECHSNTEVREWGLYYSEQFDVVASAEWANMKPESGDGGLLAPASIAKKRATEAAKSPEEKQATSARKSVSQKAALAIQSPEEKQASIDKKRATEATKSPEEKQARIDKELATKAAKSPEAKLAIKQKRQATILRNKLQRQE